MKKILATESVFITFYVIYMNMMRNYLVTIDIVVAMIRPNLSAQVMVNTIWEELRSYDSLKANGGDVRIGDDGRTDTWPELRDFINTVMQKTFTDLWEN